MTACSTHQVQHHDSSLQSCSLRVAANVQANLEAQGSQWNMHSPLKVLLLPTVTINSNQYRGRLEKLDIMRALCSGFSESSEPEACLAGSLQTDDCSAATDQCWHEGALTACVDTFRGHQCKCPKGVCRPCRPNYSPVFCTSWAWTSSQATNIIVDRLAGPINLMS